MFGSLIDLKVNGLFFLTGSGFSPRKGVCCSVFLHVRIKTKGGERDTHKDNVLKDH